jgi:hypothetical protein
MEAQYGTANKRPSNEFVGTIRRKAPYPASTSTSGRAHAFPLIEGLEFDSLDKAERAAAEAAAEIGRDRLPKGDVRAITVEVRNEHRQRVLTVTITMEIHRVDPEPVPPRW